jgi:hypothetical protein
MLYREQRQTFLLQQTVGAYSARRIRTGTLDIPKSRQLVYEDNNQKAGALKDSG